MLQGEHSAFFFTFIKLALSLRSLLCLFLSGNFTQILQGFAIFYSECSPLFFKPSNILGLIAQLVASLTADPGVQISILAWFVTWILIFN